MRGHLDEHGDAQRRDTRAVQQDGQVVELAEDAHAQRVDDGVRDEERRVDADGHARGWGEGGVFEGDGGGD